MELKVRPGEWRDPDLRDARKVGALPSVTTILSLLDKPGLDKWRVTQGIKAAWDAGAEAGFNQSGESGPNIPELLQKSEEYTRWTQDFGTATHWWINQKLKGSDEIPPMMAGAEEVADGVLEWCAKEGYSLDHTEHRFVRPDLGWAGTVDLMGTVHGRPCIIDLKTQEPPLTPYLEHALQLAGYDYALRLPNQPECRICEHLVTSHQVQYGTLYSAPVVEDTNCRVYGCDCGGWETKQLPRERISLIANRLNPGEVKEHIWVDKGSTVAETNARYDAIWLGLVNLWMMINKYDPREGAFIADTRAED